MDWSIDGWMDGWVGDVAALSKQIHMPSRGQNRGGAAEVTAEYCSGVTRLHVGYVHSTSITPKMTAPPCLRLVNPLTCIQFGPLPPPIHAKKSGQRQSCLVGQLPAFSSRVPGDVAADLPCHKETSADLPCHKETSARPR
eukprot:2061808-Rhodomonas_salina.4